MNIKTHRNSIIKFFFISSMVILNVIYSNIYKNEQIGIRFRYTLVIVFLIFIMELIIKKYSNKMNELKSYKNCIYIFTIEYIFFFTLNICLSNYISTISNIVPILLIQGLLLGSLIFICYIFKIKLSYFKWNIKIKNVFLILFFIMIQYFLVNKSLFINISKINLRIVFLFMLGLIYPGMFEELLYRGAALSGIKYLKFNDSIANIIQAILFGISHFGLYSPFGKFAFIGCSYQALVGYLFGQIYLYTGSLSIPILFHALYNICH